MSVAKSTTRVPQQQTVPVVIGEPCDRYLSEESCEASERPSSDATIDAASTCSGSSASTCNALEAVSIKKTFLHVDYDNGCATLVRSEKSRSRTGPAGFISSSSFADIDSDSDAYKRCDECADGDSDVELASLPSMFKIKTMDGFDSPSSRTAADAEALRQGIGAISTLSPVFNIKTQDSLDTPAGLTADGSVRSRLFTMKTLDGFDSPSSRTAAEAEALGQGPVGINTSGCTFNIEIVDSLDTPAGMVADGSERYPQMEQGRSILRCNDDASWVQDNAECSFALNRERSQTCFAASDLPEVAVARNQDTSSRDISGKDVFAGNHTCTSMNPTTTCEPSIGTRASSAMNSVLSNADLAEHIEHAHTNDIKALAMAQQHMMMMGMFAGVAPPMISVPTVPTFFTTGNTQPSPSNCALFAAQAATQAALAAQVIEATCPWSHGNSSTCRNTRRIEKAKPNQVLHCHDPSIQDSAEQVSETMSPLGGTSEPTTLVVRNLPLNYRRNMLLKMLDHEGFAGDYNFVYLPVDFDTGSGLGYAFVNLVSADVVPRFWRALDGYNRWMFPSAKVLKVGWSTPHQGLAAHVKRFRNSPLMHESVKDEYRPILLEDGQRISFPPPTRALWAPKFTKACETSVRSKHKGK